jgi:hypothetical protein
VSFRLRGDGKNIRTFTRFASQAAEPHQTFTYDSHGARRRINGLPTSIQKPSPPWLCFTSESRLDYTEKMRGMINEFIKETGMEEEDSKKLETTLLKAEKKFTEGSLQTSLDQHSTLKTNCGHDEKMYLKHKWFANVYSEPFSSRLCFTPRSRLDYAEKMRGIMINEFIGEMGMKEKISSEKR